LQINNDPSYSSHLFADKGLTLTFQTNNVKINLKNWYPLVLLPIAATVVSALGAPQDADINIYPYDGAKLLAGQRVDLRVEASKLEDLKNYSISLNGKVLTDFVQTSQGTGQAEWTLRNLSAKSGANEVLVKLTDAKGEVTKRIAWTGVAPTRPLKPAKNVILFIADGMSWNTMHGAQVIAKGYNPSNGMPRGKLEMESGAEGMASISTSSFDSYIVDSANSATSIATGQKAEVNALNVYRDNSADTLDNPRAEIITEIVKRSKGASVGIVSNVFGTDATPAAFATHTRRRGDYASIADQYFKGNVKPDVLMFGGSEDFIPSTSAGSRRKDATDWITESQKLGYTFVNNRTELLKAGAPEKLFGLFNLDNFPSYLDRATWKRPEMLGAFTDMPYLWDMTNSAISSLEKNDKGFFLMVEAGMVDKYLHPMDWTRAMFDVLELDKTVKLAKEWAAKRDDTLIIVTADHGHSLSVFGGYDTSKGAGNRDAAQVYEKAGFPNYYEKLDQNGIPLPVAARGLAVGFGAHPDYCETYSGREVFQTPTVSDGKGGFIPNPKVCSEPGAFQRIGNLPKDQSQGVHTADPVPLFAFGPGAKLFQGSMDQTEIFFAIANAMGLNATQSK
jgi:alkaline phosphatase